MKIDVVKYGYSLPVSLCGFEGYIRFRDFYSYWFLEPGEMYVRYVGKDHVGRWRYIRNKSTDFYRLPFVDDEDFIEKLNYDFKNNIIRSTYHA